MRRASKETEWCNVNSDLRTGLGMVIKEGPSEALTSEIKYESWEGAWEDPERGCCLQSLQAKLCQGSERYLVGPRTVSSRRGTQEKRPLCPREQGPDGVGVGASVK